MRFALDGRCSKIIKSSMATPKNKLEKLRPVGRCPEVAAEIGFTAVHRYIVLTARARFPGAILNGPQSSWFLYQRRRHRDVYAASCVLPSTQGLRLQGMRDPHRAASEPVCNPRRRRHQDSILCASCRSQLGPVCFISGMENNGWFRIRIREGSRVR